MRSLHRWLWLSALAPLLAQAGPPTPHRHTFTAGETPRDVPQSPASDPPWEKKLSGARKLVYVPASGHDELWKPPLLRLFAGGKLAWSTPRLGGVFKPEAFEESPDGAWIALWDLDRCQLSLLDAKTGEPVPPHLELQSILNEAESMRLLSPCPDATHSWPKGERLKVTLRTAPDWSGVRHEVTAEVLVLMLTASLNRVTQAAALDLVGERARFGASTDPAVRAEALGHLAWAAGLQESRKDPQTVPFFLEVARDSRTTGEMLLQCAQGVKAAGKSDALAALIPYLGRDPRVDAFMIPDWSSWQLPDRRVALIKVLASADSEALQTDAFLQMTSRLGSLGEIASAAVKSREPGVRTLALKRLDELPPDPGHLSAALLLLDGHDATLLPLARKVFLANLEHAPLKRHTAELLDALTRNAVLAWPEGLLAIGIYLQASGQPDLAGGLFAQGVELTEEQAAPLHNELLNRLALNLLVRHQNEAARPVLETLKERGGPTVCALLPREVRIGAQPQCLEKVSTPVQAERLRHALDEGK